jgi:hypothetical protein
MGRMELYLCALRHHPQNTHAMRSLALLLDEQETVSVANRSMRKRDLLVEATVDGTPRSYLLLALDMKADEEVVIRDRKYTRRDVVLQGIDDRSDGAIPTLYKLLHQMLRDEENFIRLKSGDIRSREAIRCLAGL